jgi:hypothetical protein
VSPARIGRSLVLDFTRVGEAKAPDSGRESGFGRFVGATPAGTGNAYLAYGHGADPVASPGCAGPSQRTPSGGPAFWAGLRYVLTPRATVAGLTSSEYNEAGRRGSRRHAGSLVWSLLLLLLPYGPSGEVVAASEPDTMRIDRLRALS